MKTLKDLALELCRREGKKKGVNIAQMSEILARLVDIGAEQSLAVFTILGKAVGKKAGAKFTITDESSAKASAVARRRVAAKRKARRA